MKLSTKLTIGHIYTRAQLQTMLNTQDATLNTGMFMPKGYDSLLLFVTEQAGSDRPQYRNKLTGDQLECDSQPQGRHDSLIINHLDRDIELLVFYRVNKQQYPHAGFRHEGPFDYVTHNDAKPIHLYLQRAGADAETVITEEVDSNQSYNEGSVRQILVNAVERDRRARLRCIAIHGKRCKVCGFDFEKRYGELGVDFIHVHHTKPLADYDGPQSVDPERDLIPVCPNCHAMLHRRKPCLSVAQLAAIVKLHP